MGEVLDIVGNNVISVTGVVRHLMKIAKNGWKIDCIYYSFDL